jgi:hypothetical protein
MKPKSWRLGVPIKCSIAATMTDSECGCGSEEQSLSYNAQRRGDPTREGADFRSPGPEDVHAHHSEVGAAVVR